MGLPLFTEVGVDVPTPLQAQEWFLVFEERVTKISQTI